VTSIGRTVYRRIKRSYITKELIEAYTPTKEERHYVETMTRSEQYQLNLMLWLKLFPCLGYFPGVDEIPSAIVTHVRKALSSRSVGSCLRHPTHPLPSSSGGTRV
jgi:hypothetical protein